MAFTFRNTSAFRKIMDGVRHAATAHGFWVRTMELAECRRTIAEIVDEWRPLGCLLYVPSGIDVLPRRDLGVPVVHINPTTKEHPFSVLHDRAATAQLAAHTAAVLRLIGDCTETGETCPDCGSKLIYTGGCKSCPQCGWSKCS